MCVVSVIMAYGRDRIPGGAWTPGMFTTFEDMLRQAQRFDKAAKQPDCEHTDKDRFIEDLKRRVAALEAQAAQKQKRRKRGRVRRS